MSIAEQPYRIERENFQKPGWSVLSKKMFPLESLGHIFFPQELEGRLRPITIFDQPIKRLGTKRCHAVQQLKILGLTQIHEVLNLTLTEFYLLPYTDDLKSRLSNYLKKFVLSPHAKLMQTLWQKPIRPHPPDKEMDFILNVETSLAAAKLRPPEMKVIRTRFGLDDGVGKTFQEIGLALGVHKEIVRQRYEKALRQLRNSLNDQIINTRVE